MLENIVFQRTSVQRIHCQCRLLRQHRKNKAGKSVRKTKEVDFFVRKDLKAYDIRVTAGMLNPLTRRGELRPYFLLCDQAQKVIVVNRPIEETRDEKGFTVVGVTDFLLRFIADWTLSIPKG